MNLNMHDIELIREAIVVRLLYIKSEIGAGSHLKPKPPLTSEQMRLIVAYEDLLEKLEQS